MVNVKVTSGGERHARTKILIYTVFFLKMSVSEIYMGPGKGMQNIAKQAPAGPGR